LQSTYKNYPQIGGDLRSLYLAGTVKLTKKDSLQRYLGIQLINNKEGDLLGNSRYYLTYAHGIPLNDTWKLTTGFSAGLFNYYVKGNHVTGGINVLAPDGNLGFHLNNTTWDFGLSMNQIFNNEIQPYLHSIQLKRHLNALLSYTYSWRLNPTLNYVKFGTLFNYLLTDQGEYDLYSEVRLFDAMKITLGYHFGFAIYSGVSWDNFKIGKGQAAINLLYYYPVLAKVNNKIQTFEIGLAYHFKYGEVTKY
jgi:hypothetical protein